MSDPDNQFDDELVSANPNQRNWRGILIALLVIAGVLALIVTSVALLTPPDDGPRVRGRRLRLQDLLSQDLTPFKYNATWISGEDLVYRDPWGGISLMHAGNLSTRSLMSNTTFRSLNPVKFSLSADRRFLLLAQNVQKLYRHSYLAQYSVYDTLTTESYPLTPLPDDVQSAAAGGGPPLLLASWTPRGHGLLTVRDYDIYYRPAPRSSTGYRLTDTARPGVVHHGVPDWLYEEEILQSNTALWMSADGHLMLYATFNDTLVEEQHYPWYGAALEGEGRLYPEIRGIRYPKPGTRNPLVTLTVADLADPKHIRTRHLTPPAAIVNEGDHYFTSAQWISLTEVCVVWLNRAQNLSVLSVCKSPMWFCQETYRITADSGWAEPAPAPLWSADGAAAVTLAPLRDGPAGLYRHAVRVPRAPHAAHAPLTHGRFEVTRLLAWDHRNHHIYYLGIPESAPGQQHLYRVSAEPPRAGAPQKLPYCVTCAASAPAPAALGALASAARDADWDADWDEAEITTSTLAPPGKRKKDKRKEPWPPAPQPCLYHNAHFSPTAAYFVLECLGPAVPTSALYRTALPEPRLLMHMQNNTVLKEKLSQIALPGVRTFAVQISGGYAAQVRLLLPPGLREDEITRYPLVLLVYGAPGTQLVTERWRLEYASWLAGARGAVVASVDGRGSAGQGLQLVHEVHRRLGTVDVADQLEVTEYLRDSLHFIDARRVAVWGWSYGGFVAALALASPLDVFHCGIAIAPVVSWRLYDSAYAERYMGAPNASGSYAGYAAAEVTRQAARLRDKPLLLAHGAADDNVHLQHSMALARALADKGAVFRQQIYPDEGHSLSGVKKHLYRSMTSFLEDCFRKQVPPESKAGLRNGREHGLRGELHLP